MRPGIGVQGGTRFPREARCGKRVPESAPRMGHCFRKKVLRETASRSELKYRDTASLANRKGALPAVDADSAPFALSFVEVRSSGLVGHNAFGPSLNVLNAQDVGDLGHAVDAGKLGGGSLDVLLERAVR